MSGLTIQQCCTMQLLYWFFSPIWLFKVSTANKTKQIYIHYKDLLLLGWVFFKSIISGETVSLDSVGDILTNSSLFNSFNSSEIKAIRLYCGTKLKETQKQRSISGLFLLWFQWDCFKSTKPFSLALVETFKSIICHAWNVSVKFCYVASTALKIITASLTAK